MGKKAFPLQAESSRETSGVPDPGPGIRPATVADIPEIRNLEMILFETPWTDASIRNEIDTEGAFALCAQTPDLKTAGYILSRAVADEWHIMRIGVSPEFQKLGIGAKLMATAEKMAMDKGLETAYLEVAKSNLPACSLYLRAGFHITGTRPNYYGRDDALNMKKELKQSIPA